MLFSQMVCVFLGGGIGSCLRWLFGLACTGMFPGLRLGIVGVNLLGCFAVGAAAGYFARHAMPPIGLRLFVITGLLGGFTTFSAFSLEAMTLLESKPLAAAAYLVLQVAGGLLLTYTAYRMTCR